MRISLERHFAYKGKRHYEGTCYTGGEDIRKNGIISTDVFSAYRDGTQIGESEDNLMRVCSRDIAAELLEMTFGSEEDMQEW